MAFVDREDLGAVGEERFGNRIRWICRYRIATGERVIDYTFEVENTGNVSLAGPVTIDDDLTSDESCPNVDTVGDFDALTASNGVQVTVHVVAGAEPSASVTAPYSARPMVFR